MLQQVLQTLRSTSHNGFPVYARASQSEGYPARRSLSSQPSFEQGHGPSHAPAAAAAPHVPATICEDAPAPGGLEFGSIDGDEVTRRATLEGRVTSDGRATLDADDGPMVLEGLILRSQLLVLLQKRHFCDALGRPVGREASENEKSEYDLEVGCLRWLDFKLSQCVRARAGLVDKGRPRA